MAISTERMKSILNNPKLSDKEVEVIRDELRASVKIIFEKWFRERNQLKTQNQLIKEKVYGK